MDDATRTDPAGTTGYLVRSAGLVEEYSDGSERVFFTEDELNAMRADPLRFELVACRRLHPRSALLSDGSCGECERLGDIAEAEAFYAAELKQEFAREMEAQLAAHLDDYVSVREMEAGFR